MKIYWPLWTHDKFGTITQGYGENKRDYSHFNMKGHNGIDIAAPLGTHVHGHEGEVTAVGFDPSGYGNYIRIADYSQGANIIYAHLLAADVSKGDRVERGDIIGRVGNTGYSTAPHLHIDVTPFQETANGYAGRVPFTFIEDREMNKQEVQALIRQELEGERNKIIDHLVVNYISPLGRKFGRRINKLYGWWVNKTGANAAELGKFDKGGKLLGKYKDMKEVFDDGFSDMDVGKKEWPL